MRRCAPRSPDRVRPGPATSPGLLLLDEPLSARDAKVRIRLRKEINDLQRRLNITTIMVTHDQEGARNGHRQLEKLTLSLLDQ